MATNSEKKPVKKKRTDEIPEPVAARIVQAVILIAGIILLLSVFFGGRWGPALTGGLIFLSAFSPIKKPINTWLLGRKNAQGAEQADIYRMAIGGLFFITGISGLFL